MGDLGVYWQAGFVSAHVRWRAAAVIWHAHARRLAARARQQRHVLFSSLLVAAGGLMGLAGGAVTGRLGLGLVMIAEAAALIAWGLQRDDGLPLPRRGARTVAEILEDERMRP